jgi:hypothetical protein
MNNAITIKHMSIYVTLSIPFKIHSTLLKGSFLRNFISRAIGPIKH